ncbi:hypothetical protein PV08_09934 [Exophiala spinifera]|uniref:Xylanolytic transcriptional activator regulatory domain-containing protein n=1 Tax=Exophiala spinifera TaxID=91928 RepID=A0A0D1YCK3_9EURO|nr:uncharacterized protein PV08_09934 [Exophiala spinifera]KIW12656.1 hypothetical protein PV08_09934 [Exophiala spinifera]
MASRSIAPIEIGSFTASSPHKTEFIGSASGVFFVNTVFRAFAQSAYSSNNADSRTLHHDPGSVDSRLVDPETPLQAEDENVGVKIHLERDNSDSPARSYGIKGHGLGVAPSQQAAKELLVLYLRNWHPLFPFLHGPTLLESVAALYEVDEPRLSTKDSLRARLCKVITCQCVFNIADLDNRGQCLPSESQIESSSKLLSLLGYVANNHDIQTIQALLAAQLYLVSTMALRAASTVGGTLARIMYHAGLHRCPYRYPQLDPQEGDLRKRIFWSAYVLDRYLSQALGHPLGFQDSDLDVCIPGTAELHRPVTSSSQQMPSGDRADENEVLAHLPREQSARSASAANATSSVVPTSRTADPVKFHGSREQEERNSSSEILANYVLYCRLTGQALELFHKSLQNRKIQSEDMVELQSEVHSWWNGLPASLQDEYTGGKMELSSTFTFFFITLYNQLLLLINRPFLSLSPRTLEFRSSLQTCVTASRQIISTLRHQSERNLSVSWPGMLSVSWMAGLVLSFACTLKLYPFNKAQREIEECIDQITAMDRRWNNARHCAEALKSMLATLKQQYADGVLGRAQGGLTPKSLAKNPTPMTDNISSVDKDSSSDVAARPRKRRKADLQENDLEYLSGSLQVETNTASTQRPGPTYDFDPDLGGWPVLEDGVTLPTLEYMGPHFAAGSPMAGSFDNPDHFRLSIMDDFYINPGAFGNIGWEAMANGTGYVNELGASSGRRHQQRDSYDMP